MVAHKQEELELGIKTEKERKKGETEKRRKRKEGGKGGDGGREITMVIVVRRKKAGRKGPNEGRNVQCVAAGCSHRDSNEYLSSLCRRLRQSPGTENRFLWTPFVSSG